MEIEFSDRAEWKGRGRPRRQANPAIVALVRRTQLTGTLAKLPVPADTPERDVSATLGELRRAAESAGLVLHYQPRTARAVLVAGFVQFYAEDSDGD